MHIIGEMEIANLIRPVPIEAVRNKEQVCICVHVRKESRSNFGVHEDIAVRR